MWAWIFGSLCAAAIGTVVTGTILGARARGRTSTQEGPEVYAELVRRNSARNSQREGKSVIKQKTWVGGTGKSAQVSVSYSREEIVAAWRQGNLKAVAPGIMIIGGLLGIFLFGGLTLISLGDVGVLFGIGLIAMGGYGFFQFAKGAKA